MQVWISSSLISLSLVYFIKSGETAYVQAKQNADLVFAVNKAGSFFGDIDFTLSN